MILEVGSQQRQQGSRNRSVLEVPPRRWILAGRPKARSPWKLGSLRRDPRLGAEKLFAAAGEVLLMTLKPEELCWRKKARGRESSNLARSTPIWTLYPQPAVSIPPPSRKAGPAAPYASLYRTWSGCLRAHELIVQCWGKPPRRSR